MAGQAVTFRVGMVSANGSHALNGQASVHSAGIVVNRGSFALNGQIASLLSLFGGEPILLHAEYFDTTLRAEQLLERSRLPVFGSVSLVDENGEVLTDENGNALTATVDNVVSFILHALPDDWNLTANQVSE